MLEDCPELQQIRKCIEHRGGKLFIVGGAVRDYLLGKNIPHDIDLVITGIDDIFRVKKCLPGDAVFVGKRFPVYRFESCGRSFDVALSRVEKKSGMGHTGFEVVKTGVSIKLDALRRDFTVNSIYMDLDGTIYDPVGGVDDLKERVLRPVSNKTFSEDPLRVFRLFRYEVCLGFKPTRTALKLVKFMSKKEIQSLPIERVIGEMQRVYNECPESFSKFILLLDKYDVLRKYYDKYYEFMSINTVERVNYNKMKQYGFEFPYAYSTLFLKIPPVSIKNKSISIIKNYLYFRRSIKLVQFLSKFDKIIKKPNTATCYELYNLYKVLVKDKNLLRFLECLYTDKCVKQLYRLVEYFSEVEKQSLNALGIMRSELSEKSVREKFLLMVIGVCSYDRGEARLKLSKC